MTEEYHPSDSSDGCRKVGFGFGRQRKKNQFLLPGLNAESSVRAEVVEQDFHEDQVEEQMIFKGDESCDHVQDSQASSIDHSISCNDRVPMCETVLFEDFVTEDKPCLGLGSVENANDIQVFKKVRGPLGVCYDEKLNEWVIADSDNDRVILYPSSYEISVASVIESPSAVCIMESGISIAILSKRSIVIFNRISRECTVILHSERLHYLRGLGRTPGGNVVSIHRQRGKSEIVIYSATSQNKCLRSFSFDNCPYGNPSFLHITDDLLVISDLGQQKLFLCNLNDKDDTDMHFSIIASHSKNWDQKNEDDPCGGFCFVSGIQVDRRGMIVVADARGKTFQLFDRDLNYKYRIYCDFDIPYVSSFFVNKKGEMLMCDRKGNKMVMAQFTAVEEGRSFPIPNRFPFDNSNKKFYKAPRGGNCRKHF